MKVKAIFDSENNISYLPDANSNSFTTKKFTNQQSIDYDNLLFRNVNIPFKNDLDILFSKEFQDYVEPLLELDSDVEVAELLDYFKSCIIFLVFPNA